MPCPYPFDTLSTNYPREDRATLYRSLGWDTLIDNPDYQHTCAIRMSICLLRCGMPISQGELIIYKGPLKGRRVKIRYNQLSDLLASQWGAAEVFAPLESGSLGGRQGVLAFYGLPGGYPGHIDIVSSAGACGSGCYFGSREGRFWAAAAAAAP